MVQAKQGRTIEHYTLKKQLGDGQFGVGWLAHDSNEKEDVCVKVFKEMDSESEKTFRKEVEAGQTGMIHPNILKLLGAGRADILENGQKKGAPAFYIVSELATNGEAYDYVEAAEGLEPKYARQLFGQLLGAIDLIHNKGVAHRDLKLENCFLDKNVQVKVADFGLSQAFNGPNGQALKTQCGTPNYMGPEFTGETYEGAPADIYAMGVMLFLITQAQFPFSQANDVHYRRLHRNPAKAMNDRKIEIEETLLDLIVGMTKE
jgi:MAP/microtubule affinity-regulating kinase